MGGSGSGGPNRKPTTLKVLEGNPGRRPLNPNEPKPEVGMSEKPRRLSTVASAEWDRLGPALVARKVLTVDDGLALSALVTLYARLEQLGEAIDAGEPPVVDGRPSPLWTLERETLQAWRAWLGEFGLTPSSRSKITTVVVRDDTRQAHTWTTAARRA
jgi:P27 family predicted phage terminase small subunit